MPRGEEAGPPRADARSPPRAGAGRIARPINFTVGSTGSRSTGPGLSGSGEERQEHDRSLASILWPGGRSGPIGSELRGGLNGTEGTGSEPAPLWRSLWRSRVKQQLPLARVLSSNRVRLCREHNERRQILVKFRTERFLCASRFLWTPGEPSEPSEPSWFPSILAGAQLAGLAAAVRLDRAPSQMWTAAGPITLICPFSPTDGSVLPPTLLQHLT